MSLSSRFSTLTRQTETTGTLTSAHGLLQSRPPLHSISELSQITSSFYPSCATSTTAETKARFQGPSGPLPPFLPPPLYPEFVLPKDKTDIVLRLSDWEIRQLVTPIKRGIIMGDSLLMIRDLASDVMVKMRASEVMRILEEHDLYTPSVTVFDSINSGSVKSLSSDEGFGSLRSSKSSVYSIPRAIYVPPPKNRADLINRLTEREVRELLAPVKSGVLTDETIFSVADAITDMRFAVSAAELMKLFPGEDSVSSGYDTISHIDLDALSVLSTATKESVVLPAESKESLKFVEEGPKWCTKRKAIVILLLIVALIGISAVGLALALMFHTSSPVAATSSTSSPSTTMQETTKMKTERTEMASVHPTTEQGSKSTTPAGENNNKDKPISNECVVSESIRCENGGIAHCKCPPGFYGQTCQDTEPNDKSMPSVHSLDCCNRGTASCQCTSVFTGPRCSQPVNSCIIKVSYKSAMVDMPLCYNGECMYDDTYGNGCKCDDFYEGSFCDSFSGRVSQRCIAYDTSHPSDVKHKCKKDVEHCITDDLDCLFNTSPQKGSDGKEYCPEERREIIDGTCKCKNPIGWCLPKPKTANSFSVRSAKTAAVNVLDAEAPENLCQNPPQVILYDYKPGSSPSGRRIETKPLCGQHGKCIYSDENLNSCQCDEGYYGDFCEKHNDALYMSQRCLAYEPNANYTVATHYRCDLSHERCMPDNIDCLFNMATAKDKDGNAYCPDSDRAPCDGMCKCKNPVGWCIPLETYSGTFLFTGRPASDQIY